jgi:hypothetical protein
MQLSFLIAGSKLTRALVRVSRHFQVIHPVGAIKPERLVVGQYEVEPRALVQAVKRNIARFSEDFMFQLNEQEFHALKSQIVISSWGGMRRAIQVRKTET